MSTKFYTLLTDIGAAKLASAAALGVPLKITHMAVGDGGGVLPTPDAKQTALVNEKRRAALNMLYIDPQNSSQIIAETEDETTTNIIGAVTAEGKKTGMKALLPAVKNRGIRPPSGKW